MRITIFIAVLATVCSAIVKAADTPIVYQEGFESGSPKWQIWAKNADKPCTMNYVGPSAERAFAGERSLKLDLTFQNGK